MARSSAPKEASTKAPRRRASLTSLFTLAGWRLRPMWRLLLVAGLGTIAATLLVCIVPLFTQVALSAGVQKALASSPDGAQINITAFDMAPTSQDATAIQRQLDTIVASDMGSYVPRGEPRFSVSLYNLQFTPDASPASGPSKTSLFNLVGSDMAQTAQQYTIIQGRLPAVSSAALEIALSQPDAAALKVKVGDVLHTQAPGVGVGSLDLRVVGVFRPPTAAAALDQFGGQVFGPQQATGGFGGPNMYWALASNQSILTTLGGSGSSSSAPQGGPPPQLSWVYQLDGSRISANSLNDVIDRLGKVQTDVSGQLNGAHGLQNVFLNAGAYQVLSNYRIQILLMQIPLLLLLLQVMALALLFIRMMADMLVDRQADAIATLRSRGATRRQIFNTFTLHNIGLSLIALVVSPLAAIPIVRALSLRALPPASQGAVAALSGNPLVIAYGLRWYALVAVVVSGFAMVFSTNRAASNNILTLRRENARTTTKPFWQRLNLDLIFGGLALLGYVAYAFAVRQVDPRIQLVISPVSLIASLLMLVAAALLFLRLLPLLLGLGSRLATRGRGASSMIALTQLARAPKQPIRMTLLLALSTAFTLFTLVYSASQAQRLVDVAAFQTGADFTGALSASAAKRLTLADLTAKYRQIPGVTGASLGYTTTINPSEATGSIPIQLFVVDPDTYAQSARWPDQASARPLSDVMAELRAARPAAAINDGVPAIVDDATWQTLRLTPGARFVLQPPGYTDSSMTFVAAGHTPLIPTVYDSFQGGGFSGAGGGVLADYQSYATVYHHDLTIGASDATLTPNAAWIATRDDAASLASVRKALSSGDLALGSLQDRRKVLDDERSNPLQIEFANTLLIGAATALLLALIGIWVGSWLNARGRVVNFAVLRALGATPRQLRALLVWEQAIAYIAGGALGIALGWTLSLTALPMLIFVELATQGNFGNVPDIPPARVVVPGDALALAFGALAAICVLALILTMGALARLSLGQTLRLNED